MASKLAIYSPAAVVTLLACTILSIAPPAQAEENDAPVIIDVQVNGTPASFLLDTGAERSVLDQNFAGRNDLHATGVATLLEPYGTHKSESIPMDDLTLQGQAAGLKLGDQILAVSNQDTTLVNDEELSRRLHGEPGREVRRAVGSEATPRAVDLPIADLLCSEQSHAQSNGSAQKPQPAQVEPASGTSTDIFVGGGSDFDRPGLLARANYGVGIGHTFGFLKKSPAGDELTFGYTYENAGTHGFLHTAFGEHTESFGAMKNFAVSKVKLVSGYTWVQGGITSYTGNAHVQNRFDSSASLGMVVHLSYHTSIWIQESYNKVVTVPWYTSSTFSYTYSR